MTKDEALKLALEAAYLAGFDASGEGYNAEYPFGDHKKDPEQDAAWVKDRDNALRQALAQPEQEPVAWESFFKRYCPWLEQPEQEPVEYWTVADGWVSEQAEVPAAVWVEPEFWEHCNRVNCGTAYRLPAPGRQPLYTAPPQRKPLSDERIGQIIEDCKITLVNYCSDEKQTEFARAIEAAHGIRGQL